MPSSLELRVCNIAMNGVQADEVWTKTLTVIDFMDFDKMGHV